MRPVPKYPPPVTDPDSALADRVMACQASGRSVFPKKIVFADSDALFVLGLDSRYDIRLSPSNDCWRRRRSSCYDGKHPWSVLCCALDTPPRTAVANETKAE